MPLLDAVRQTGDVGDEQVVADQLALVAELVGQDLPAVPVVLGHAVLDGDDRIAADQVGQVAWHCRRQSSDLFSPASTYLPFLKYSVEAQSSAEDDVVARLVAGRLDRLHDEAQRFVGALQVRREAALVADVGVVAGVLQRLLQRVEHLGAHAHRLGDGAGADRHDHELLEVDRVVGVRAAVDDVHHRHRQQPGLRAADVAVERQLRLVRRRLGDRQADAEDGVGAEPAPCWRCRRGRSSSGRWRPGRLRPCPRWRRRSRR